jgi:hypothetical protein
MTFSLLWQVSDFNPDKVSCDLYWTRICRYQFLAPGCATCYRVCCVLRYTAMLLGHYPIPVITPRLVISFTIFFRVTQQPKSVLGPLTSRFIDHSQLDTHTHGWTPLNEWSAHRRDRCLHNTQRTQDTNIHALSGIRTCDPSNRASADLCLRPCGHRDRLLHNLSNIIVRVILIFGSVVRYDIITWHSLWNNLWTICLCTEDLAFTTWMGRGAALIAVISRCKNKSNAVPAQQFLL